MINKTTTVVAAAAQPANVWIWIGKHEKGIIVIGCEAATIAHMLNDADMAFKSNFNIRSYLIMHDLVAIL